MNTLLLDHPGHVVVMNMYKSLRTGDFRQFHLTLHGDGIGAIGLYGQMVCPHTNDVFARQTSPLR